MISSFLLAVLGLIVAAWSALWPMLAEGAPLRKLVRVSAIIAELPQDSAARVHLQSMQDEMARSISQDFGAPRAYGALIFAWFLRASGATLVGIAYLWVSLQLGHVLPQTEFEESSPSLYWAFYALAGVAMIAASIGVLHLRAKARRQEN